MGQMTTGLFYGCRIPDSLACDGDVPGTFRYLVEESALNRHGKKFQPYFVVDTKPMLLGVWIAIAGDPSEHPGAVDMSECVVRLGDESIVPLAARKTIGKLINMDDEFHGRLKKKIAGEPCLWLAPVDIA